MKTVYCANCGTRLNITRKALPKYSTIIDIVEHHLCPSEPVALNLALNPATPFNRENVKFIQKLDELNPRPPGLVDVINIGDRRPAEHVKSGTNTTAPLSVLERIKGIVGESDD